MRTLLIDGDILAYQVAASNEETFDWGENVSSKVVTSLEEAKTEVLDIIGEWCQKLKADDYIVCMSDDDVNWRKAILPTYKENRSERVRPELLYPLKHWMAFQETGGWRYSLEADDLMGILATHPRFIRGAKIIVSIDKDMKQIPNTMIYNWGKDTLTRYTTEEADLFHMTQVLTGDQVDNYKGCPGIGPKKAEKILASPAATCVVSGSPWAAVVEAYESRGLTEADALVQARVSRICRWTDYDYSKLEVKLWEPPAIAPSK